jgi:N-methylhydantoinase A
MELGYINPDYFLGGDMKVDIEASKSVIKEKIAGKLGLSLTEASHGIYRLASANMVGAMRVVTVQRGYDPRDFTLVVFGGTGAIFAVRLAQELHIPRIVIPMAPGCFSALGLITSDASYDVFRSYVVRTTKADPLKIQSIYDDMKEEAVSKIRELGFKKSEIELKYKIAMRYEGQAHEVTIEVSPELAGKKLTRQTLEKYEKAFHEKHRYLYGHSNPEAPCEFFTLSITAVGPIPKAQPPVIATGSSNPIQAFKKKRKVFWRESNGYVDTPTYERSLLKAGNIVIGPAIIEQMDTTTVIPPDQEANIDKYGNIIIDVVAESIKR